MIIKAIASLYLFNGLSMLIIWPILIATDQVSEINTQFVYMFFHLSAEFITALLCIVTGLGLLLKKGWSKYFYFLTSGIFLSAGYLAIFFYFFSNKSNNLIMITMLLTINIIGLLFLIMVFYKYVIVNIDLKTKCALIFNGSFIYTLLNVAGFLAEMRTGYTAGYVSMVFILLFYTIWNVISLFKNKVTTSSQL